ncbi:helix-turn-helix domain-containing protein [Veillonella magna]|uniref:Helix-turn-helix transcriptional regulator n=1 Tax=Veillonella magna TaxID=464322 RepID=A0ABS2GD26_9FIRM|nr:helix-turn-helix transcriptional regulator [Veillonella magna]MBM6823567.1 helix-turn-helix transcriptional regulator [Veillonella magna]MBM6911911.1 helix-turn-helix transcriptional regulator [Veillonella magna]
MNSIKRKDALDFIDSFLTTEEIAETDLRVALVGELIEAREKRGVSQRRLESLSGVKQPVIARIERGASIPKIDTLLKLLTPLGKTLAVVPLKKTHPLNEYKSKTSNGKGECGIEAQGSL